MKEAYTCAALVSLLSGTTEMLAKRLVGPGGGLPYETDGDARRLA